MSGVSIDHIVSIIIFIAAIVLFVGLFSQTIQTGITYQQHQGVAAETSNLLDNMLLNPGSPSNWGQTDSALSSFGVQDPEFTQYELSAFSLMRLGSSTGNAVEYTKTPNMFYNNISLGGSYLLTPTAQAINYSSVLTLLGINNTYGFQLSLTPQVTISITETQACSPLSFTITANGIGFPFANSPVNYCLILVTLGATDAQYPSYTIQTGITTTNQQGMATVTFPTVTDPNQVYSFVAYAHMDGIVSVGYHTRDSSDNPSVIPLLQDMGTQEVALAHSYDLNNAGPSGSTLKYNVTFVIATQDFSLSELSLGDINNVGIVGSITSGAGNPYPTLIMPTCTTGILIVTYQQEGSNQGGVIMMPWGISSLAFPVTFGGDPSQQEWVATDLRQVTIGSVSYQAKLSLWSSQGQVTTQ